MARSALIAALVLVGAGSALAADAFGDLSAPDAEPDALARRVDEVAGRLARGTKKVRRKLITYCSQDEHGRAARAAEIEELLERGCDALAEAGFANSGEPPATTVVEVDVRGGFVGAIEGAKGHTVLIRNGPGPRQAPGRGKLPTIAERPDGLPIARDVVHGAARLRLELWRRAGGASGDAATVHEVLARRLVRWAGPGEDGPAWLNAGLEGWLATRMTRTPLPEPGHVCASRGAAGVAQVLDPAKTPAAAGAAYHARIVDALVTRRVDLLSGANALEKSGEITDTAFGLAFGVSAAEIAKFVFPSDGGEAACQSGALDCTLCVGEGKLEIACPDCAGTGAVGCPSCYGSDACISRTCIGGYHYYDSGEKARCGYCGGSGSTKCKPCRGKGSTKCRSCRGGKETVACPACVDGKVPCPEGGGSKALAVACGEASSSPCRWCKKKGLTRYCEDCGGAGYRGCRDCYGTLKDLCPHCAGSGVRIMVYTDGTIASSTKCPPCNGKGYTRCKDCSSGSMKCECGGKGVQELTPDDCPMCEGDGALPDIATTVRKRRERLSPPSQEESEGIAQALQDGVDFILGSRKGGGFALREFRSSPTSRAGSLNDPTLFSNAICIWTLSTTGITREHEKVKDAYRLLEKQADALTSGRDKTPMTQETSLALRALVGAGAEPDDDVVKGLVKLLVKGQKSNGLWSDYLFDDEDGEPFEGLFAIESLWLAHRRGVKVPKSTFDKAFRAGTKLFGSRGFKNDDYVTGTEVCSAVALVVISKAGSLGKDAGAFDYKGLPAVQNGLAWLDRYLDIRTQPIVSNGAFVRDRGDSGYAAYLFAIQRLGMLLSVDVMGGERWFTTGARHLVDIQLKDGSWEETGRRRANGPVRATSTALLFLARATPAVTDKDD